MKYVVVIDAQNDFITGSLGSVEAFDTYKRIVDFIQGGLDEEDCVIFTQDTHDESYAETLEGQYLPVPHCFKDTWGWKIPGELMNIFSGAPFTIEKITFGSFQVPIQLDETFGFEEETDEILICGFCTDICVVSNALILRAAYPNAKIAVLANLCEGSTPINHVNALEVMKANNIEVRYIGTVAESAE